MHETGETGRTGGVRTIAVTGKGGTGKTVLATLLIRMLAERLGGGENRVLAIDADSAMSLPYTLGIRPGQTVSDLRKGVIGSRQLKQEMNAKPTKEAMRAILARGDGFDLLAMGRPEEPGCFCAVNDLLRYGIDTLAGDYEIAVIDGEAGPEQLNRRVIKNIDLLLVVADMSARSLETAAGIIRVARGGENSTSVKHAGLVLNRVREDAPAAELLERVGLDVFGEIPEDAAINRYDREGASLRDLPADTPGYRAVERMLDRILRGDLP